MNICRAETSSDFKGFKMRSAQESSNTGQQYPMSLREMGPQGWFFDYFHMNECECL